jgi:hypothetical protein
VKGQVFVRGVEIRIFGPGKSQMIPPFVAQNWPPPAHNQSMNTSHSRIFSDP